ncbi:MAG: tRNA threonylcarbamoyladenosine dehydratase [Firmicutes bacterium]|nr:tRNA threonylcarbamoyladenosine dehydratase [Bacillota bacterium]HPT84058.1 tRNA threonylcarbamoyladenosine dehydratase [Limnochordia bacterium]
MEHRFIRTELVFGPENLQRLREAAVAVVGVGGVGGHAAEALARSGVGTLILIDYDVVALSNLNRQIVALESTLGRPKVEVMAERIAQINPECRVITHRAFYSRENHGELLPDGLSFVADAIDSVRAKVDLIEACRKGGVPIISSLGAGNKVDPTRLRITDISQTHTCALARAVRGALRKRGIERGVTVVFSDEKTVGRRDGSTPGSTAFVPGAAGLVMASWIVRQICGEG